MSRGGLIALLVLVVGAIGCAPNSSNRMPAATAAALRTEKVASVFFMVRKEIHYTELVYKVVYNETRTHESTFEGLWDIDSEYSERWNAALRDVGIRSQRVVDLVDASRVEGINEALTQAFPSVPLVLSEDTRRELAAQGISYLVALKGGAFSVDGIGGGDCRFNVRLAAFVYDVRANRQVHVESLDLSGKVTVKDSLRDFEADDLALLKAKTNAWFQRDVRRILREAIERNESARNLTSAPLAL